MAALAPPVNLLSAAPAVPVQQPYHLWHLPDGSAWALFYHVPAGYLVRFPDLADFVIAADGSSVAAWPAPGTGPATLEHLYLNQALPLALSRQRKLVLHASAVAVEQGAIAFMGSSGQGKSTLAASFALHGHPFLTDDSLLLDCTAAACIAQPSHPSLRLWDDSRHRLLPDHEGVAPPVDYSSKARLLAGTGIPYCAEPRVLRALFLLGGADCASVHFTPVPPATTMLECVRNCFLLELDERATLALHFGQLGEVARLLPCFRVDFPRRYEALPGVRADILEFVAQLPVS